ncbi:MAG: AbrB/MazE/SpoVT family DNA-binding domain-containing protein [Thermodesulfobacteriota bacterium]|nr:AbrB/MazE/SpoVT family DNA-binding domain-containing protein [Thermodesulfobacteriota bacterium]
MTKSIRAGIFTAKGEEVKAIQHVSRISSKDQVTIPANIRKAIGIEPGDMVAYELQGKSVKLKKIEPFDAAYHAALSETLEEWNSPEDEEAFNDL